MFEYIENAVKTLIRFADISSWQAIYLTTLSATVLAGFKMNQISVPDAFAEFTRRISPPLRRALFLLVNDLYGFLDALNNVLFSHDSLVIENEANLLEFVGKIRSSLGRVDTICVYDCLSLPEYLVLAAYIERNGISATFLRKIFFNPFGKTRFVTDHISESASLWDYARLLADRLGARKFRKISTVDILVHSSGEISIESFLASLNIREILGKCLGISSLNTLVVSDHGYDILYDPDTKSLFVTHGYFGSKYTLLIPFSRIAFALYLG